MPDFNYLCVRNDASDTAHLDIKCTTYFNGARDFSIPLRDARHASMYRAKSAMLWMFDKLLNSVLAVSEFFLPLAISSEQ